MEMSGERSLVIRIGLQLHRRRGRSPLATQALRSRVSALLFRDTHGTITVEYYTLGNRQSRRRDVPDQPSRRQQFYFFLCRDVTFYLASNDYNLAGNFGAHLGAFADRQRAMTLNLAVDHTIDPGGPLKNQLPADTASFI